MTFWTKSRVHSISYILNSHYEAYLVYQHLAQQDPQMLEKFETFLREAVQKIKEQNNAKEELEYAFTQWVLSKFILFMLQICLYYLH